MKLRKTIPSCHGGSAIFSVDIQPGDRRLATGGRADSGAGLVVVWDFKTFVLLEKDANRKLQPLCRLENHFGCVTCVRWSESGRYLASAGDDALITVMQYAGRLANSAENGLVTADSGKTHQNVELWKCVHTLRGHAGDVLHIAWSPGDLYLASCSIDNQIIVWNGRRLGEKVATLVGHEGLVKGVTWDPVGKYLASQSDDKSVRIWLTSNWTVAKVLQDPFADCSPTTQFLRLDWSPDGSAISSAHAMNNGGPVSVLIQRAGWDMGRDLVGHRKGITCTRWSSCIYESWESGSDQPSQWCLCAIGSKDKSVSVWSTEQERPVVVGTETFTQSVMDLAWSHSGKCLVACSSDGAIFVLIFTEGELGRALSSSEKAGVLSQLYGKYNVAASMNGYANGHDSSLSSGTSGAFVIENPEIMKIQQQMQQRNEDKTTLNGSSKECGPGPSSAGADGRQKESSGDQSDRQQKQTEVRTKDGKRRIKPIFIGSAFVPEPNEQAMGMAPATTTSKDGEAPTVNGSQRNNEIIPDRSDASPVKSSIDSSAINSGAVSKTSASDSTSTPIQGLQIKRRNEASTSQQQPLKKIKQQQQQQQQQRRSRRIVSSGDEDNDEPSVAPDQGDRQGNDVSRLEQLPATSSKDDTRVSLPVPAKKTQLTVAVSMGHRGKTEVHVTCQNGIHLAPGGPAASKLTAADGRGARWQTFIGSEALALAASTVIVAVGTCNRCLSIFKTSNGSRLMPPLALDSDIAYLSVQDHFVMIVTSAGMVYVWRFNGSFTNVCKESILPVVSASNISLVNGFIIKDGAPVLTLSNGASYVYDTAVNAWLLLFDPQDAVAGVSLDAKRSILVDGCRPDGPFSACLRAGTGSLSATSSGPPTRTSRNSNTSSVLAVAAFLECQMKSAQELHSPNEYRFWFTQYVQHLAREGLSNPLKHLCDDLTCVRVDSGSSSISDGHDNILGISKIQLLHEILPIVASNPKLQRLYSELKEQVSEHKTRMKDKTGDDTRVDCML